MRIVHLSDIHIGRVTTAWRALLDKRALGFANWLVRRYRHFHAEYMEQALADINRLGPELVVCTGDITCVGSPEEFRAAREALAPLRTAFGNRFLYIPGNHDAYVRDSACRSALEAAFRALNGGRWELGALPVDLRFSGLRIFMVDSATPMSWRLSSGRLSADTLQWLDEQLSAEREPGESRLLLCHFPTRRADGSPLPPRRAMAGAQQVREHLHSGRLDLSLCGHMHDAFAVLGPGGKGEVCAGSLTLNGIFNVVDWLPDDGHFSQFFVDVSRHDVDTLPVAADLAAVS